MKVIAYFYQNKEFVRHFFLCHYRFLNMVNFGAITIDFSKGIGGFLSSCGLLVSDDFEESNAFEKAEMSAKIKEAKSFYNKEFAKHRKQKYEQENKAVKVSLSRIKTRKGDSIFNQKGEQYRKSEAEFYLEKAGKKPLSFYLKEILNAHYSEAKYQYVVPNRNQIQGWIDVLIKETQRIRNEAGNFTFLLNRVKKKGFAYEQELEEYKMIARSINKIDKLEETIDLIEESCLEPQEKTVDYMSRILAENPSLLLEVLKQEPSVLHFIKQHI